MHNFKLIILLFLVSLSSVAKDSIIVNSGDTYTLSKFDKDFRDVYVLKIDRLVLNNNSILLIPNYLSNKKVKIVIKELSVSGHAYIAQTFSSNNKKLLELDYLSYNDYLTDINGRSMKGHNGKSMQPAGDGDGDDGRVGNNGSPGVNGRSTVSRLELDINIVKFGSLEVVLAAQNGGHGGHGGPGQDGSDTKCDRDNSAGNGGDGGRGGKPGLPGNVGDVVIYWQSDIPILTTGNMPLNFTVKRIPGAVGNPGDGGRGGLGGDGIGCLLYRHGIGGNGKPGKIGSSARGHSEYFFLGSTGKVSVVNKDSQ